jgi:hypothetical protein
MRIPALSIRLPALVLGACVLASCLIACSTTSSENNLAYTEPARPGSITYLDTDKFDENLSSLLAGNASSVTVSFLDPPAVNEMPPRMNTWLAAVEANDGSLNLDGQDESAKSASAVLALLALVKEGHEMYKESKKYTPAENYNATIHLEEGGVEVKNIEFVLRESS